MKFSLINKDTKESFGELTINLLEPKESYDLGNSYKVEVLKYMPDFYINSKGEPDTKTKAPNNPAFVFNMITPDKPQGEISFVAIQKTIESNEENKYKMKFEGVETKNLSALTVRKDMTLWILGVGGAIFMVGVIQGMYWNHRRIWLQLKDGNILLAGHTNKNWYGLKNEMNQIVSGTSIVQPIDQKEAESNK